MENTNLVSEAPVKVKKGITGSTLKIIAIAVMFIDHFAAIVLDSALVHLGLQNCYTLDDQVAFLAKYGYIYYTDMAMRLIGRLGFPIFCFLLVEGFTHTHNKWKYLRNLALFALISEVPFDLGFAATYWYVEYQNVFFTLTLGLIAIIFIDMILKSEKLASALSYAGFIGYFGAGLVAVRFIFNSELTSGIITGIASGMNKLLWTDDYTSLSAKFLISGLILGAVIGIIVAIVDRKKGFKRIGTIGLSLMPLFICYFAAEFLRTDYSGAGVLTIVIVYWFKKLSNTKAGLMGCITLTIMQLIEITSFFTLIPIRKYNGKRGISLKYFFYAFYPVHILLLYLVTVILGYNTLPWIH